MKSSKRRRRAARSLHPSRRAAAWSLPCALGLAAVLGSGCSAAAEMPSIIVRQKGVVVPGVIALGLWSNPLKVQKYNT